MVNEQMSVTQALVELKVLDARIDKILDEDRAYFIAVYNYKTSNTSKEDMSKAIQSYYDRINDLIKRRNAIKSAVIKSNANTEVTLTIDGNKQTMSVAEAIDLKSKGMAWKKALLRKMAECGANASRIYDTAVAKQHEEAQKFVATVTDDAQKQDLYDSFIAAHPVELVDTLKLQEKCNALDKEISDFESMIDVALSVSNANTNITVMY